MFKILKTKVARGCTLPIHRRRSNKVWAHVMNFGFYQLVKTNPRDPTSFADFA